MTTTGAAGSSLSSSWSNSRRGSGFNVQFGGGGGRTTRSSSSTTTRIKWLIEKVRQCLNVAVTYQATPNIEINTIGGVYHAMQSFKTIIVDHFKKFHGVKVHFNVEGMYTSYLFIYRFIYYAPRADTTSTTSCGGGYRNRSRARARSSCGWWRIHTYRRQESGGFINSRIILSE